MVEIPKQLIEPVGGGRGLVAVANVVLAELGCVAEVLEQTSDGGIELAHAHGRARNTDLRQALRGCLAGDE